MAMAYSGGFNTEKLKQAFFRKAEMVDENVEKSVEKAADMIVQEAKANAPVDTHNLESAIHTSNRQTRSGNHAIDVEVSGTGDAGRDVAEYALEVHERLEPAPGADMKLGPLSEAKQASDPMHIVGGKYLERAVQDKKAEAVDLVRQAVREAMSR